MGGLSQFLENRSLPVSTPFGSRPTAVFRFSRPRPVARARPASNRILSPEKIRDAALLPLVPRSHTELADEQYHKLILHGVAAIHATAAPNGSMNKTYASLGQARAGQRSSGADR